MVSKDFAIPVIDFALFRSGSEATKEDVAREVVDAFKTVGFIYIKNHGVDEATISKVFAEASCCLLRLRTGPTGLISPSIRAVTSFLSGMMLRNPWHGEV